MGRFAELPPTTHLVPSARLLSSAHCDRLLHAHSRIPNSRCTQHPQPRSFAIWLLTCKYTFFLSTARTVDTRSFNTCASEVLRGMRCPVFRECVSGVFLSRHLSESDLTRSDMALKTLLLELHVLHPANSFYVEHSSARNAVSMHLQSDVQPKSAHKCCAPKSAQPSFKAPFSSASPELNATDSLVRDQCAKQWLPKLSVPPEVDRRVRVRPAQSLCT